MAASSSTQDLARAFHDNYAKEPDQTQCKAVHEQIAGLLTNHLKTLGEEVCIEKQYMGSSYEGTKVRSLTPGESDYEFDLMIIRRNPSLRVTPTRLPGFFTLQVGGEKLSRQRTYDKFKGNVQKAINATGLSSAVIMHTHGAAVDLHVTYQGMQYTVDMTPTYEHEGKYYVPREPKPATGSPEQEYMWFESCALKEKALLKAGDEGNGCRREVYRICKILRQKKNFRDVTSYMWKNAVLNEMTTGRDWNRYTELGKCTIAVLERMARALESGKLPMRFNPSFNLLSRMPEPTRSNHAGRIRDLIKKPHNLFQI